MKKVVALLLVLGFACVANASLVFQDEYQGKVTDVEPSDVITLVVSANAGGFGGPSGLKIVIDQPVDNATPVTILGAGLDPTANFNIGGPFAEGDTVFYGPPGGGWTGFPAPTGEIFEFSFHVPDLPPSTIITVDLVEGVNFGTLAAPGGEDGMAFAQFHVPEPLTLSLLGLGGLVLRRRR